MTGTGVENALSKLVDLLSCDNDVAQETIENVLLNLLGCVSKGVLV